MLINSFVRTDTTTIVGRNTVDNQNWSSQLKTNHEADRPFGKIYATQLRQSENNFDVVSGARIKHSRDDAFSQLQSTVEDKSTIWREQY